MICLKVSGNAMIESLLIIFENCLTFRKTSGRLEERKRTYNLQKPQKAT